MKRSKEKVLSESHDVFAIERASVQTMQSAFLDQHSKRGSNLVQALHFTSKPFRRIIVIMIKAVFESSHNPQ